MIANPGKKLRDALKKGTVVVPGTHDPLGALLIEKEGFQAGYVTGAGLSAGYLGKPDIGLLTRKDVAESTRRITDVVRIPMLVDVDTGFGGEKETAQTVRALEKAGAAGVQIEDQLFPKRCGHLSGKELITKEAMVKKLKAAVRARQNKDFVIVARTDARGVTGLGDALSRAWAYKEAGADIIFPEALESKAEFEAFGRRADTLGVLMANMTEFGRSPALTVNELAHLGFRLVLFPMTAFRVAAFAMEHALKHLRSSGSTQSLLNKMQTRKDLYKLIRYSEFERKK